MDPKADFYKYLLMLAILSRRRFSRLPQVFCFNFTRKRFNF